MKPRTKVPRDMAGKTTIYLVVDDRGIPCRQLAINAPMAFFLKKEAKAAVSKSCIKRVLRVASIHISSAQLLPQRKAGRLTRVMEGGAE